MRRSVARDDTQQWNLITSRTPDNLPDFLREIEGLLSEHGVPEQPVY